jgi:hypothetical protein
LLTLASGPHYVPIVRYADMYRYPPGFNDAARWVRWRQGTV